MKKTILLPTCYSIKREENIFDFESGIKLLSTNAIDNIVEARIDGNNVVLTNQYWFCPYCLTKNSIQSNYSIDPDAIFEKYSQSNFFSKNSVTLFNNSVNNKLSTQKCDCCDSYVVSSLKHKELTIEQINDVIKLYIDIRDVKQLIDTNIIDGDVFEMVSKLPLKEVLTLDFNNNKALVGIEDLQGKIVFSTAFNQPNDITDLIDLYVEVKEYLCDMLKTFWTDCDFPFETQDINSELLPLLVRFVGYPEEFYNKIPFELGSKQTFKTFESMVEKLGHYSELTTVFDESRLPNYKSIKRILYNEPSLFFYLHEIEDLLHLLKNRDNLVKILKSNKLYKILAYLHMFPCIFDFINDYLLDNSSDSLVKNIINNPDDVTYFSLYYAGLRDELKEQQLLYNSNRFEREYDFYINIRIPFSLPVKETNAALECKIKTYEFITLKNVNELHNAGEKLNNCLKNYSCDSNPVVVVKNKSQYIAAIEINDYDEVIQAYAKNNDNISDYPKLKEAIIEYFELNHLNYDNVDF